LGDFRDGLALYLLGFLNGISADVEHSGRFWLANGWDNIA
jgi:hypothetical protein